MELPYQLRELTPGAGKHMLKSKFAGLHADVFESDATGESSQAPSHRSPWSPSGMERVTQRARLPAGPDLVDEDSLFQLVEQIQSGTRREESCERLFRKFRPLVHSFFLRKGFTSEESRDLTQDVFLRVFKGIDAFRRESRFERWLWEIADNIFLNEVRRRKTEKRHGIERSLDACPECEDGSSPATEIPAEEPSPEDEVLRRQNLAVLRQAFQQLPDQMRRCCILRYEKGFKYQEIADIMGISIETVKAHLHQARKRLADLLGGPSAPKRGGP